MILIAIPLLVALAMRVRDEGIGIAPENLAKVWERLYQVDPARSGERGSMGLGLSMVKQIVQMHGGNAFAESEIGAGSTFTVKLPLI